jgi:hypothetical protein
MTDREETLFCGDRLYRDGVFFGFSRVCALDEANVTPGSDIVCDYYHLFPCLLSRVYMTVAGESALILRDGGNSPAEGLPIDGKTINAELHPSKQYPDESL